MMNSKIYLIFGLTLVVSLAITPALAVSDPTILNKALVNQDGNSLKKVTFYADGSIPVDGSIAMGYGLITNIGLDGIIVSTTHAGVLDSEKQIDANDPVWHNHFVALQDSQDGGSGLCTGLEIKDITFEAPGNAFLKNSNQEILRNVPLSFNGTHSITEANIAFHADSILQAVSFTLSVPTGNPADAVCVNDVQNARNQIITVTNPP